MHVNCERCAQGPAGIEGHADLLVQSMSGYRILLKCALCGCFWSRSQPSQGLFEWSAVSDKLALGASQGVAVPPRSGAARFDPLGDALARRLRLTRGRSRPAA